MTGLEVIAAIFIVAALAGAVDSTSDAATKTEICLMCVTTETAKSADVDAMTEPNLLEDAPQ